MEKHTHKFLISKRFRPYLAAAPSSDRLTLFGGSRARLVRTPQAERHISVLFESSSITTNWCTEGERQWEKLRREGVNEDKAGQR